MLPATPSQEPGAGARARPAAGTGTSAGDIASPRVGVLGRAGNCVGEEAGGRGRAESGVRGGGNVSRIAGGAAAPGGAAARPEEFADDAGGAGLAVGADAPLLACFACARRMKSNHRVSVLLRLVLGALPAGTRLADDAAFARPLPDFDAPGAPGVCWKCRMRAVRIYQREVLNPPPPAKRPRLEPAPAVRAPVAKPAAPVALAPTAAPALAAVPRAPPRAPAASAPACCDVERALERAQLDVARIRAENARFEAEADARERLELIMRDEMLANRKAALLDRIAKLGASISYARH